jgi:ABC-type polysaccharide/polyol phosphate transport system ATPase subunit
MAPAPPAIEARGLTKRFVVFHQASSLKRAALEWLWIRRRSDAMTALEDLNFTVAAGETIGVVGSNGSGKSTLLMLLAGIYRPSAGQVTVRGKIATLLDLYAGFHPDLTAEDNAILAAMINGLSRKDALALVDEIVAFAGLQAFADHKVRHFSAGMVVRLGFAAVAYSQPDVLLVDEVLAVGDEAFQARCRARIAEFQAAGKTIVVVSHDLDVVRQTASRVLWLDAGRLRLDGPAEEVLAAYHEAAASRS